MARVYLWCEKKFEIAAVPFGSVTDAIDCFVSTTAAVGVTEGTDGSTLRVYAPFGLQDVFAMHRRPNRRLAARDVYDAKVGEYKQRWPDLTSEPW